MRRLLPVLLLSACLDTSLPGTPPPPGAGIVQGTVVWVEPGQGTVRPATGATLELLGVGVRSSATGETATFSLTPVDSSTSPLLIRFDADGDGLQERQRVIDLAPLAAGRGKTITLGQVTVGNNGFVRGTIRRADVSGRTGHAGTAIVIPETPYFTYTGDDGSFLFDDLPQGLLRLATFREGYSSVSEQVDIGAGTVVELAPRTISRLTGPRVAKVQGRVLLPDGTPADTVAVQLSSGASTTTSSAGTYEFSDVPYGVFSVAFSKQGFLTAQLVKVVFSAPTVQLRDLTLAPGVSTTPMVEPPLPPYDGGLEVDAGFDGGGDAGLDAGFDGGGDAGLDAGFDGGDAGLDAGFDGGSDAGLDAGVDGGDPDAGSLPVARVQAPASVTPGASFTLNAQTSTGDSLSFLWQQLTGPTVTFPNVDPSALGSPTLTAPAMASLLRFRLRVRDASGQESLPVTVTVPVGFPPTPRITPASVPAQIGGQRLILSGASSTDPGSTGITRYEWTVSPPNVGLTVTEFGSTLQLDMPPSVPTPIVVNVQLHVTNGVTIRSTSPASVSFSLTTGTAPQWFVDAGLSQGVSGGAVVTLRGAAFAPATASFTYRWSPDREPDSGVADFILTNPTAPETTFVAPEVVGATPRIIVFTLTATDTSGSLTPSVQSAQTIVQVNDRKPPRVVGTSISNGFGPITWAYVEFDEPVGQGQVQVNVISGSPQPNFADGVVSGTRIYSIYRPPLSPGFPYTLTYVTGTPQMPGAGVADLNGNFAAPYSQSFVTQASWSPAFESVGTSMAEPRPGLTVRQGATPFSVEVFAFARNDVGSWFFRPVDPFGCGAAPCQLLTDSAAPAVMLSGPVQRGHKGVLWNDRPVALLQAADVQGTPGVLFNYTSTGWVALPPPPSTVFSDGTTLASVGFDAGTVTYVTFDGGAWLPASVIATNATDYATTAGSTPFAYGSMVSGGVPMVVLKQSQNSNHSTVTNTPPWTAPSLGFLGSAVEARVTSIPESPNQNLTQWLSATGNLTLRSGNGNVNVAAANVSSFDSLPTSRMYLVALVTAGQLELRYLGNGLTLPRVAGVTRDGGAGFSLNADPSCEAARPELATDPWWRVYVTWQERCGSGPWRVYIRALE